MENENEAKQIDWPLIVKYLTKRCCPLIKDEIAKLVEGDKRLKENKKQEKQMKKKLKEEDWEDQWKILILKCLRFGKQVNKQKKYFKKKYSREIQRKGKKMMKQKNLEEFEMRDKIMMMTMMRRIDDDNIHRDEYDIPDGYTSDPELKIAKRSYKFSHERGISEKRQRAQSAKGERKANFD